jgi:hypothetical protein
MIRNLLYSIRSKWQTFWYNFGWSDWMGYIDGWVPRFAFFVPIVGYLIIFNDYVGGNIAFQNLLGPENRDFPLDSQSRLRLVYFGLIFLGMSNIVFRLRQPHIFRLGKDRMQVTRMCLDIFTYGDFLNLHGSIRHEGHRTLDGKYYDSEWKGFVEAALNEGEGTDHVRRTGDWDKAKKQYGSLLNSILSEFFFRENTSRKWSLIFCIIISTFGYILLAIPSIDLFLKVLLSTIHRM